jgi:RHS repeat-associated protein
MLGANVKDEWRVYARALSEAEIEGLMTLTAPVAGFTATPVSGTAPVAGFMATPVSGTAPLTVTFTDASGGEVSGYAWDYGDGITSTTSAVTHTHAYTATGVYTVSLTVTGPGGTDALTRTNYITVSDGSTYSATTTVITYTYDPLHRLTEAAYSDGTSYAYQYDAVGNRVAMTTTAGTITTTVYTHDAANRLTFVGGVEYTYDDSGNLTNDGTFTYTWNAAGRLIEAESVTHTIVYTYNGDGVRVAQEIDGQSTSWVQDAIGLAQVLIERTDTATTTYLYGLSRLAQVEGSDYEWFLGDALGSVRHVVDDSGAIVLARDYGPYGQVIGEYGTGSSGYGYTGEQRDVNTGLVFLRARWYDSWTGRFISEDRWPVDAYRPTSLNLYVYVQNNSLSYVDPSGHQGIFIENRVPLWEYDITSWPRWARATAFAATSIIPGLGKYEVRHEAAGVYEGWQSLVADWFISEFRKRGVGLEAPRHVVRGLDRVESLHVCLMQTIGPDVRLPPGGSASTVVEYGSGLDLLNAETLRRTYQDADIILTEMGGTEIIIYDSKVYNRIVANDPHMEVRFDFTKLSRQGVRADVSIAIAPNQGLCMNTAL